MQDQIKNIIQAALIKLKEQAHLPAEVEVTINVEPTKTPEHGEFATNVALLLAKKLGHNPWQLAEMVVAALPSSPLYSQVVRARPGFINFHLSAEAFYRTLKEIETEREKFGYSNLGKGKTVLLEFVSANPTGPLHVGHGRGAAFGATVGNLLEAVGFKVYREYYVNDAGRQIDLLTLSIWLRYLELFAKLPYFPAGGYKGAYIVKIAQQLQASYGPTLHRSVDALYHALPPTTEEAAVPELCIDTMVARAQELLGAEAYQTIMHQGVTAILADIREDLAEFGVTYDRWLHESELIKSSALQRGIAKLQESGYLYTEEGATWFRATALGDEKDRVLVRANGHTTYFASDVGYHLNKYERGFAQIIDIFGADHHGYLPRINAFLQALQIDLSKLKIILVQFAILYRGKERIQMSTRSGEFITLRELRAEVGNDAARFFYLMRKNDQHLDFDLELAKSQSAANPVYYIQYAHARICRVMEQLTEKQLSYEPEQVDSLHKLTTAQEKNILRRLLRYPVILQTAALSYEPHHLAYYLRELANDFHTYYNAQQFLVAEQELRNARLYLINAVKQVLVNGLTLLGVSAPETM